MAYVVGQDFSFGYSGTLIEVTPPNCVSYNGDDGGELLFTATSVGTGVIHVQTSDGSYDHSVSVICDSHSDEFYTTVPATCTEQGYDVFKCSICGTERREYLPALGHNFVFSETIAPTCVDDGYDIYACSRCDVTENRNPTDALGHDWGEPYEENGSWYKKCNRCGLIVSIEDPNPDTDPDPDPEDPDPPTGGDDNDGDGDDTGGSNTGGNTGGGTSTGGGTNTGGSTVVAKPISMYQWDYGQTIEIDATGMSTVVEVHFAHRGMNEAIAYACAVQNGVITAPIPNECLEQTSEVKVWVYEYDGDSARTTREITISIIPRTRPPRNTEVPQSVGDRYTEVITQMNTVVDGLRNGSTVVKRAENANVAAEAKIVKNAENATNATSASFATMAGKAHRDSEGMAIHTWYLKNKLSYLAYDGTQIDGGLIEFRITDNYDVTTSIVCNVQGDGVSSVFGIRDGSNHRLARLRFDGTSTGKYSVYIDYFTSSNTWSELINSKYSILYQYLSAISNKGEEVGPTGGIVTVGTTWDVDADVNTHTVTVTGGLSVYQDSTAWQVTAERVGVGTVTVTNSDDVVVSQTTYTIVEK